MTIENIWKGAWCVSWLDDYGHRKQITYVGVSRKQAIERAIHEFGLTVKAK